ncbi:MAG TPA: acyltransferase [Caulobacteraceae bacterium]|jgi:peptidoglycan/LPS O-acetylase OafA/YrhL|nr:acyltransferase [Caulobacteraceae bacterium]
MGNANSHRYRVLDGLRGVAAAIVVAYHASYVIGGAPILPRGYLAVDFFFLISGFVLSAAYEERIREGRLGWWALMRLRVERLHPLIVLGVILGLAVAVATRHPARAHVVLAGLSGLVPFPWGHHDVGIGLYPANPPTWSLFLEYLASMALPLAVRRSDRMLALVAGLAAIGLVVCGVIHGSLEGGGFRANFYLGPVRLAFSFTAGMLLYRWRDRVALVPLPGWLLALGLLGLSIGWASPGSDLVIVIVAFPIIVALAAASPEEGKVWRWAGDVSYPLYIVHYPLVTYAAVFAPAGLRGPAAVAAGLASLGVAELALHLYDAPLRAWLARRAAFRAAHPLGPGIEAVPADISKRLIWSLIMESEGIEHHCPCSSQEFVFSPDDLRTHPPTWTVGELLEAHVCPGCRRRAGWAETYTHRTY